MRVGLYLLKELFKTLNLKSFVFSGLALLACFVALSGFALVAFPGGADLFGRVEIVAVLKDDITASEINELYLKIQSWMEVASIKYVPKEAAKEPLVKDYLEITLKDPKDAVSVSATLQDTHHFPQIESVIASQPSPLSIYLQRVPKREAVVWGALASLFLISLLMIRFAIGSLANSFMGQIEILQLSGVSPSTIRSPFVLVGILYGLLGASGTVLLLHLAPVELGFGEAEARLIMAISSGGLGALLGAIGGFIGAKARV